MITLTPLNYLIDIEQWDGDGGADGESDDVVETPPSRVRIGECGEQ